MLTLAKIYKRAIAVIRLSPVAGKKKNKTTYKYINTTSTTSTYDSVVSEEKINKKGSTKKKKKIFEIAKKHNAYSYVKDIKEDKIYTIDEFKDIFK